MQGDAGNYRSRSFKSAKQDVPPMWE